MPKEQELPSTLKRSDKKAQETWQKTHDSAQQEYGEGERAHRTAFASLKHGYEKVGDHWEAKDTKGASDPQSKQSGQAARERPKQSYGGVDVEGRTKDELADKAKHEGLKVTSDMTKDELGKALDKQNQKATAKARKD